MSLQRNKHNTLALKVHTFCYIRLYILSMCLCNECLHRSVLHLRL